MMLAEKGTHDVGAVLTLRGHSPWFEEGCEGWRGEKGAGPAKAGGEGPPFPKTVSPGRRMRILSLLRRSPQIREQHAARLMKKDWRYCSSAAKKRG